MPNGSVHQESTMTAHIDDSKMLAAATMRTGMLAAAGGFAGPSIAQARQQCTDSLQTSFATTKAKTREII
jgi:hypothetical protein